MTATGKMIFRLLPMTFAAVLLHAQSPLVQRGAEIYRTTCGVAYCHGSGGTAGRAPQLAGRGLTAQDVFGTVSYGRPGTAMPAFVQQLKSEEIEAVTQYVLSLPAPAGPATPLAAASVVVPPAVKTGHDLFFDAVRMGGCGRCHELNEWGSPIGPDLKALTPAQIGNLRGVPRKNVVTASPVGEAPFPAIVLDQTAERVRVYDIESALPVLRYFRPAQVRITRESAWSHATAAQVYSDAELESISGYLTWLANQAAPAQPKK